LLPAQKDKLTGQVIKSQSGFYRVVTDEGPVTAHLRGRFKRGPRSEDIVAVGDWVDLSLQDDGKGMIEAVHERERMFSRMAPTARGEYQQIIIANPDQAVFVFACALPSPRLGMLDRFLVIAEEATVPAIVVANKVDLVAEEEAEWLFDRYAQIGYLVLYTSALTGAGVADLKKQLSGKVSVMMGPSGAGKSSLLNAIQPGLGLEVRSVSQATTKGRHTTVVREMFPLEGGGYVADTPGLKALALYDIEPEEIDGYFPEIRSLVSDCQFSNCTHMQEPGCAVIEAVETGLIHIERYEAYARMRLGDED
jgi:ribosome biogenesis GTPase